MTLRNWIRSNVRTATPAQVATAASKMTRAGARQNAARSGTPSGAQKRPGASKPKGK